MQCASLQTSGLASDGVDVPACFQSRAAVPKVLGTVFSCKAELHSIAPVQYCTVSPSCLSCPRLMRRSVAGDAPRRRRGVLIRHRAPDGFGFLSSRGAHETFQRILVRKFALQERPNGLDLPSLAAVPTDDEVESNYLFLLNLHSKL